MRIALLSMVGFIAAQPIVVSAQTRQTDDSSAAFLRVYDNGNVGDKTAVEAEVRGAVDALGYANADLAHNRRPELYCPPPHLALTNDQVISMVRRAQDNPSISTAPLPLAILFIFENTFPCGKDHQ